MSTFCWILNKPYSHPKWRKCIQYYAFNSFIIPNINTHYSAEKTKNSCGLEKTTKNCYTKTASHKLAHS